MIPLLHRHVCPPSWNRNGWGPLILAVWGSLFMHSVVLSARGWEVREHVDEIVPRNVMWQELPRQVREVFVDPHDRVWYQLHEPTQAVDLATVRAIIKREFTRPAPQIVGARPVLFEPGGRVWFAALSESVLLGYDGKAFVEKHADTKHSFPGNCPNHGRVTGGDYNLFAANTAFFLESHGVIAFSGEEWAYQQMTETPPRGSRAPVLYPSLYLEQDGKGVTAFAPGTQESSVWRWRGGKWTKIPLPAPLSMALTAIAPWQEGVLLFTASGINYHRYNGFVPGDFGRLQRKVGDSSFKVREEGTREMIACGAAILPYANNALRQSNDPEIQMRLKQVVEAVTPVAGKAFMLGPYQLRQASFAHYDDNATIYVTAADILEAGASLGSGVVIGRRDGSVIAVAGPGVPHQWGSRSYDGDHPLVSESGKRIWVSRTTGTSAPGLFDVDAKGVTVSMPYSDVRWLQAVKSDGTVFASQMNPARARVNPVIVFDPSARDDRRLLHNTRIEIADSEKLCVTSDGRIWTETIDQGLVRYDGRKWETIGARSLRGIRSFLPGTDGSLLIEMNQTSSLIVGEKIVQRDSMKGLISGCAKEIAGYFKGGCDTLWLSVVPDANGNIWLRDGRVLSVLVNSNWLDTADALKGSGCRGGEVEFLGLCGKGGKLYMSDFSLVHDHGCSLFGEVRNGRVLFSKAPHTCNHFLMHLNMHDDSSALWVQGNIQGAWSTCDWVGDQFSLRIVETGTVQELKNAGWAKLKDKNGNMWLGQIRGNDECVFNIWREGKIVHTVTIPGTFEECALVADKPGSVFAWTKLGLRQMIAKDSSKPGEYSLGNLYHVAGIQGSERVINLSSLGFLAVTTFDDSDGRRKAYLYIIKLPAGDSSG